MKKWLIISCVWNDGEIKVDAPLDDLYQRYTLWNVSSHVDIDFTQTKGVRFQEGSNGMYRLIVERNALTIEQFEKIYQVKADEKPINLETMFPILIQGE